MDPMNPQSGEPPIDPAPGEKIIGYCRTCGKPLTDASKRAALGTVYCEEHAPNVNAPPPVEPPSPYTAQGPAATSDASPALAFMLGLIPGVGAIYNGQYAKGFVHVVVFGLLISILASDGVSNGLEPLFGLMLAAFVFYQAFEAYHTAQKRQSGQYVDEFSSLLAMSSDQRGFLTGPIILIVIGVLFLLSNFGLLRLREILRFWPLLLILLGISMLMGRTRGPQPNHGALRNIVTTARQVVRPDDGGNAS